MAIVIALPLLFFALVGGVALLDARGMSPGEQAAYNNGYSLAQNLSYDLRYGVTSSAEIVSTCGSTLSAAYSANMGIEASYTDKEGKAFMRGCRDATAAATALVRVSGTERPADPVEQSNQAPQNHTERLDVLRPDGSVVAPELTDAYWQGVALGRSIQESLERAGAYSPGDEFVQTCKGWVDNALKEGFVFWPNRVGTEDLRFNAADQDQAGAFSNGCIDGPVQAAAGG